MPDDDETSRESKTRLELPRRRPLSATPRNASPPETRYEVSIQLGRGGMGDVVAARDGVFGREVAIKRMIETNPSSAEVDRFLREARIQGGLDHPSIPPVHELAIDSDGRPYFVMKRVAGTTLATVLSRYTEGDDAMIARYPRGRLLRSFAEVCFAVEQAHTRGVIHRDLKPSNVMLGELGEVYVLDWGVAKVIGDSDPVISEIGDASPDAVTKAGTVIGTRGYMAPEQQAGAVDIDPRADVYALGCVLFELLALVKHHGASTRSPREAAPDRDVPPELDELCVAATAIDRTARLGTARELGERVQHYLDGDRDLVQRRRLAAEHLARAQTTADTDADTAMREAGRALALDPALPGAAELVGRLMIDPPKTLSPELAKSLDDFRAEMQGRHSTFGSRNGLLFYVPLIVAMLWLEAKPIYIVAMSLLACAMLANAMLGARRPRSLALAFWAVGINTAILAIIARVFTPFLVAPALAGLSILVLIAGPMFRSSAVVLAIVTAFSLAIMGPWLAEVAGLIEPTTYFTAEYLKLQPVELGAGSFQVEVALVAFAPLMVILSTVSALAFARNEDAVRQQLHLQAWRLRQLVS